MRSFKLLNRQTGVLAAAAALLFATVAPAIVSAAQLTERSVALTSSSAGATDVSYEVSFKSAVTGGAAGAVVIDFCSESPIIGQACTAPAGFDAEDATSATVGFTDTAATENSVRVTGTIATNTQITFVLDHIDNPSAAGPLYARIVTYDDATAANAHNPAETFDQDNTRVDEGGAAIYINNTIGVSAAVQESMTFCVSLATITQDCGTTTAPILALGEPVGTTKALVPGTVSTGSIFTQISTNAAKGAVVSLKSSAADCGGLLRAGAVTGGCNIAPALDDGVIEDEAARFGVKIGTAFATAGVTTATGTIRAFPASLYNTSTYALNFVDEDEGVTSAFGDKFLDTNNLPANNQNMELTFAATVSNDTPAGLYSANLSLIATGKF